MYPKTGRSQHRKMARFRLEGFDGTVACVMFSDAYERDADLLVGEAIGIVEASVDLSREEPSLKVDRFIPVESAFAELAGALAIELGDGEEERAVRVVRELLDRHPGPTGVLMRLSPVRGFRAVYRTGGGVAATAELDRAAVEALGADAVRWKPKKPQSAARRG
jgi:DNA polymerase III alpha subunit